MVPKGACTCDVIWSKSLCGAGEIGIYGHAPGFEQPFGNVVLIFVLLAPFAQPSRGDVLVRCQV